MSSAAHVTVRKALAILGIGSAQIELAPADEQGRFDAGQLPPLDERTILISAGRQRQLGRIRSLPAAVPGGRGGGRLDAYRWRLRLVGARLRVHRAPDRRH